MTPRRLINIVIMKQVLISRKQTPQVYVEKNFICATFVRTLEFKKSLILLSRS